jgi:Predicted transcriptional regulator
MYNIYVGIVIINCAKGKVKQTLDNPRLTAIEIDAMAVIWRAGHPLTVAEISELAVDKSWKEASTQAVIRSLVKKGFVTHVGYATVKNHAPRTYSAKISQEEYYLKHIEEITGSSKKERDSVLSIISALISRYKISPEEVAEIRDLINRRSKEK